MKAHLAAKGKGGGKGKSEGGKKDKKAIPCSFHAKGTCAKGADCDFSNDPARVKPGGAAPLAAACSSSGVDAAQAAAAAAMLAAATNVVGAGGQSVPEDSFESSGEAILAHRPRFAATPASKVPKSTDLSFSWLLCGALQEDSWW